MRISCLQLNPQTNLTENVNTALGMISEAAHQGADVVVLPEMFSYMGDESQRKNTADILDQGLFTKLKHAAHEFKVILVAGSHSEKIMNDDRVHNTCVTFDKMGNTLSVYRKSHLFNLRDAHGNPIYCESNSFKSGEYPESYQFEAAGEKWNATNIICYDLRFPEVLRMKKRPPSDIIFIPAAFTWQTGKDHWEVLLRARAIENQCYVVGTNQTGYYTNGEKRNYGHTMVIDPWGQVVAALNEEVGILTADVSKKPLQEARLRLPAIHDRIFF